MNKILFLNQPTVGHLNTLLSIAIQMKEDGHDVRFLVPGLQGTRTNIQILDTGFTIPERIKRNGFICELMPPPLSVLWSAVSLPLKSGYAEITHALNIFSEGIEHYTRQILKLIEIYHPDVLVTDFAFPATSLAADIAKIPYVVIYHSGLPFRGKGIPPFGSGLPIGSDESAAKEYLKKENRTLNIIDKRINRARQALGLPLAEPDLLRRPYSPWLNLITSAECMEAPRENISRNTFFVGACFGKRIEMDEFSFDFLRSDKFKIYVSLGTVFNKKPKVFLKIMRALDRPDYQVIVSAGGAYQTMKNSAIPSNAAVFKSVPQVGLLPKIDLFISHGGNNSINEALSCGKPIIVMPVGGEQADNASRVVYLGAGKRVDITRFSEEQLRAVVEEIRMNPTFQERALTIMKGLQSTKGVVTASRCIDWVARKSKPLSNKEGIPSTLTLGHLEQLLGD
jgi:MGT family glycosyltransferase